MPTTSSQDNGRRGPPPKPVALPVDPNGIPAELKARPQWVCWRYVWLPDKQKWDKPPFNARTGGGASHSDPATWSSFETAFAAYQSHGYDGVGFVVHKKDGEEDPHPGDPFIVFDLDKCRDASTGAIEPRAQQIIGEVDSYTEPSVSATGIRIIAKGRLPPKGRRKKRFEVYETKRYVTINGHPLTGTPASIENRQQAIDAVHARIFGASSNGDPWTAQARGNGQSLSDEELLELARRAKNGQKFITLHDRGDWKSLGYPSQSEGDEALCCLLVWWLHRDPLRVDAAFRRSAMYRPKWEREDYRQRTMARALEQVRGSYQDGTGSAPDIEPGNRTRNGTGEGHGAATPSVHLTDRGNAIRLVRRHGTDLRHCHPWHKWLVWDGRRWRVDDTAAVTRRAKETLTALFAWAEGRIADIRKQMEEANHDEHGD